MADERQKFEDTIKMTCCLMPYNGRIVMLGHGTASGLLGFDGFVINDMHANLLKQKDCVGIWCNAGIYFNRHELNGFYTGMIVSEMDESQLVSYCGITASYRHLQYFFADLVVMQ